MNTLAHPPARDGAPAAPASPAPRLLQRCWRGQVPAWTGEALEQLYGNLFASLPQFRLGRGLAGAHTYAAYQDGALRTLFVFTLRGGRVEVLNEVVCLDAQEIEQFAAYVFAQFAEAAVVAFRAIHTARRRWSCPHQQYDYLEDTVVTLPASGEAYTASLSKNTRRNVRRYRQDVLEDLPGFAFHVAEREQADPAQIDAIIALNHARMANKNKLSALDAAAAANLRSLARGCGLVGVVTVDGRVCAGAISYRVGANYYLMVLAHEPAFDRYSLGFLCCYLTICACIERGGREFHFLWGRYDYKRSFLGEQRGLDRLLLYRSRPAQLRHAGLALGAWAAARRRRAMLWLQQAKRGETRAARLALACRDWLRRRRPAAG